SFQNGPPRTSSRRESKSAEAWNAGACFLLPRRQNRSCACRRKISTRIFRPPGIAECPIRLCESFTRKLEVDQALSRRCDVGVSCLFAPDGQLQRQSLRETAGYPARRRDSVCAGSCRNSNL